MIRLTIKKEGVNIAILKTNISNLNRPLEKGAMLDRIKTYTDETRVLNSLGVLAVSFSYDGDTTIQLDHRTFFKLFPMGKYAGTSSSTTKTYHEYRMYHEGYRYITLLNDKELEEMRRV